MGASPKPLSELLIELESAIEAEELTARQAEEVLTRVRAVAHRIAERVNEVTGEWPPRQGGDTLHG